MEDAIASLTSALSSSCSARRGGATGTAARGGGGGGAAGGARPGPRVAAPVVADLEGPGGGAVVVEAEGQEDPDQLAMAAALEQLGGEGERRIGGALGVLAEEAGEHPGQRRAVVPDDRDLAPVGPLPDRSRKDVFPVELVAGCAGARAGPPPPRGRGGA